MKTLWSKLPSRWIRDGGLRAFEASGAAAALKVYLALVMFANFKPSLASPVAGTAALTFSQLEALCGISRRSIAGGLRLLEAHARITTDADGAAHRYVLAGFDDSGWAKVPKAHLLAEHRFDAVPIRGVLHLDALKLYLTLLSFRANDSSQALLSYDKIGHYTGIPRPRIRRAIDVLINHEWLSLASQPPTSSPHQPSTIYLLRGDFWGRQHVNYARAVTRASPTVR